MENNSQDRDVHKDNIRKSEPEEQGGGGGGGHELRQNPISAAKQHQGASKNEEQQCPNRNFDLSVINHIG